MKKKIVPLSFILALSLVFPLFSISASANSGKIRETGYQAVTDIYYDEISSYIHKNSDELKTIINDFCIFYDDTYYYLYVETDNSQVIENGGDTTFYLQTLTPDNNDFIFVNTITQFWIGDSYLGSLYLEANGWVNDGEEPEDR